MKILIAGDFCPRYRVAEKIEKRDFNSVLGEVKDIISNADYSIVNFECPVTKGEGSPIEKCGPNLRCSEKGMEAVKWVGFDCVTLANNHFFDYGKEGVENTIETCGRYGLDTVGGGMNLDEASKILYKEIEGKTIAIINCCEHEFSIATEKTAGSNPLNPIRQYYEIMNAKEKADYVLVIVHGGHEHYQLPSPRMQETYRFFIDVGADVVVNHHQHCYSGYEIYNNKPIFYGLGNFCFDDNKSNATKWNYGYMIEIEFKEDIRFEIIPYEQSSHHLNITKVNDEIFYHTINNINDVISNPKELRSAVNKYYKESQMGIKIGLFPISNLIIRILFYRKIISPKFPRKWLLRLGNYVMCESHREKLSFMLRTEGNN
jgi:poly-gamma-glutamate synthesis protein (capsule biosynthesis protein)